MGRNVADFGKDANVAFDIVQSWQDESKRNGGRNGGMQKNWINRKPATNYGAKNGNSKEARAKRAETKAKELDNG